MLKKVDTPFDTIESAQDFLKILCEVVEEAKQEVDEDLGLAVESSSRHRDALLIATYNLAKLSDHMKTSRRILNDLRTLRRLMLREGESRRLRPLNGNGNGHDAQAIGTLAALPPISPVRKTKAPSVMQARAATATA